MHIGLIGGIGVAATVVYYQRLTAVMAARNLPLQMTIVHADVQDLLRNNRTDNQAAQAEIYAGLIDQLRGAGADCAAITSLGGHFCFDETVPLSSLPLVSAVSPLDGYLAAQGLNTVGLLGTSVVMRTKLYGQLTQTRAVTLDDEIDSLGQSYVDMAVAGTCSPQLRETFLDAGQRLVDTKGAQAIVLAGTDLNLAFDGKDPGYRVVDALDVHVELLAQLAAGDTDLDEVSATR
ncbi:MAG: aspartate racemase [Roseobacter sp. MedPE-SW]|jgi:aspartate racemase|uniref:aspartate/glutamate racemase family protein n=1 Tax=Roseobacter sp. MED193 TaxID=314262 RepID=UPI000068EEC9|nr:aspartate/glutamate racemase family protein [Roseobacter sp. MED193]EAQ46194.1 aspartate racemase [Roseobacter sp. MED193]OIQ44370.1 MAG: aspartate racemase [Roseobacter sp. MedPE-SW]